MKSVVQRSFQSSWFSKWPWLHSVGDQDMVLCHTCARTHSEGKLQWLSNADSSFVTSGFSNWKYVTVKFNIHASTKSHKEAVR